MRRTPKNPLDHEPKAVIYARDQAGLTQQQLADLCNVSRSLITEIELGTRNATPATIRKLAAALNCPRVILERKREPDDEPAPATPADVGVRQLRGDERAGAADLPTVRG